MNVCPARIARLIRPSASGNSSSNRRSRCARFHRSAQDIAHRRDLLVGRGAEGTHAGADPSPGGGNLLVPLDHWGQGLASVLAETPGAQVAILLAGQADVAVHSAKDLPAQSIPGLVLAAIPERADPRDALVGSTLADLPTGAVVATGSVRRRAQLAHLRPDLGFAELRGNIHTRLERAAGFDAIVVAAAALDRLDLSSRIAERLDPAVMVPQVSQGALAVSMCADAMFPREVEVDARADFTDPPADG
jgi:hypothetical protein